MADSGDSEKDEKEVTVVKNATDLQRLKLEKLMKNPEKLAFIPEKPKEKRFSDPAEFVRNVMGSSAGAGSGEFHVYRHIRRREYSRQDFLQELKEKDELDRAYHEKIKQNKQEVEDRAAKKRKKRHRQKERQRAKREKLKEMKKKGIPIEKSSSSSESSEEEEMETETAEKVGNDKDNCDEKEIQSADSKEKESQNAKEEEKESESKNGKEKENQSTCGNEKESPNTNEKESTNDKVVPKKTNSDSRLDIEKNKE